MNLHLVAKIFFIFHVQKGQEIKYETRNDQDHEGIKGKVV